MPESTPPDDRLEGPGTLPLPPMPRARTIPGFRLLVVEGARAGLAWEGASDHCSVGYHPSNDLVLEDPTVSRFHCEVRADEAGARVRDLGSRNGTIVDGVRVAEAFLRAGSLLRVGRATLRFDLRGEPTRIALSEQGSFGSLVGTSAAMRACFALLERAAKSNASVLLEGETGTGKGQAAESIHRAGARAARPFLVVDCGAIPANLLESELFGHERGAFTGAAARRLGAFEEAEGGTIFLDEIGELPLDLQPKLLRVLESREIRRVGENRHRPVDVRVIAATHRDLRAEVNEGRFRSDLYYRLAVVRIAMPPLREHPEDLPALATRILRSLGADEAACAALLTPALRDALVHAAWPGNVRELRNHLERCLVFQEALPVGEEGAPARPAAATAPAEPIDPSLPYAEARQRAIDRFERAWVEAVLAKHEGRVAEAAAAAGIDRVYLYRLMRRHGVRAGRGR